MIQLISSKKYTYMVAQTIIWHLSHALKYLNYISLDNKPSNQISFIIKKDAQTHKKTHYFKGRVGDFGKASDSKIALKA